MQTMDDGVTSATRSTAPTAPMPAGGWPAVVVLHGLGDNRGTVELVSHGFADAGFAVLAYDARGHGVSGGVITLAGPREVADLRAIRNALAARARSQRHRIGAWGISTAAARSGMRSWPACPSLRSRSSRPGRRSTTRSGHRTSRAPGSWRASPRSSPRARRGHRRFATRRPEHNPAACAAGRGAFRSRAGSTESRRPCIFQGQATTPSTSRQASRRSPPGGPKKLYARHLRPHALDLPRARRRYVINEAAWFDRYLEGRRSASSVEVGSRRRLHERPREVTPAGEEDAAFAFAGTSTVRGSALASRLTPPLRAALETWGGGTVAVTVPRASRYPRLVVTVLAGNRVVAHGGLQPKAGICAITLANYCVYVPKGRGCA